MNAAKASYNYQLDAAGNRKQVTESSGRVVNWSYDGIYRLTNETISIDPHSVNGSVGYGLDPVGNRQSQSSTLPGIETGSFTYDPDDRLNTESYDANGNTLTTGGKTFAYDFENRLKTMNNGAVTIQYDADGNRVAKTVNGVTTRYLVDDLNPAGYAQVVEEVTNGAVTRQYTYGLQRISQTQQIANAWTPAFYGYDGAGTVRLLTDSTGTVTNTYDYDAWGNAVNTTGTTPNVYLYRGEQYDSDLMLYYLRARYYNAATGRFLNRDPYPGNIAAPTTLHRYVYGAADPINRRDPSGRLVLEETELLVIPAAVQVGVLVAVAAKIQCIWGTAGSWLKLAAWVDHLAPGVTATGLKHFVCGVDASAQDEPGPQPQPQLQPEPQPTPRQVPPLDPDKYPECVQVSRGLTGNNPGSLRFDLDGLSTYEVLLKHYPCVIRFTVCYDPPKTPGVLGHVISVSGAEGTSGMALQGTAIFTPGQGDPTIGLNHWSITGTNPDLKTSGLLKQLCPNSKFK